MLVISVGGECVFGDFSSENVTFMYVQTCRSLLYICSDLQITVICSISETVGMHVTLSTHMFRLAEHLDMHAFARLVFDQQATYNTVVYKNLNLFIIDLGYMQSIK
jgi:hypothetical protein